jgi:dienelactone hydrolase
MARLARALLVACVVASLPALAAGPVAAGALTEQVVCVRRPLFPVDAQLETTVYRPAGAPPWPLAVLNHGQRDFGDHAQQPRNRPEETARFFLERGYLVVAPMRQGFSRSSGYYTFHCDHEAYAQRYAGDIAAVVNQFVAGGEARADQVLVAGQSNGGFVLLGYAAQADKLEVPPRAIVNFSGGFNSSRGDCDWRGNMVRAAGVFGARTRVPALWLYAEDDVIFPPSISRPYFEAYQAGHPAAEWHLYPRGGHGMSNTRSGRATWGPDLEDFLRRAGLPYQRLAAQ